jgi:hypothetical protein
MTPTTAGLPTRASLPATLLRRLPRFAGTARSLVAAAGIAACVTLMPPAPAFGASNEVHSQQLREPVRIDLDFDSDLLAYDLCWSSSRDSARQMVADAIASEMTDPAALYTIRIDQLSRIWRPIRAAGGTTGAVTTRRGQAALAAATNELRDLDGNAVNRDVIRRRMHGYVTDLDEALADIMQRVREMRPGARLTLEGFAPFGSDGAIQGPDYPYVAGLIDFIEMSFEPSTDSRSSSSTGSTLSKRGQRALEETLAGADDGDGPTLDSPILDADLWLLYPAGGGVWVLASDEPLPTLDTEDPDILEAWSTPPGNGAGNGNTDGGDTGDGGTTDGGDTGDGGTTDGGDTGDGGTTDGGDTGDGGTTDGGDTGDGGTTDGGDGGTTDGGDTGDGGTTDGGDTGGGDTGDGGTTDGGDSGDGDSGDGGFTGGGETNGDGGTLGGGGGGGSGGGGGGGSGGGSDTTPGEVPTLQQGDGWTGALSELSAVGDTTKPASDEKAIARWDVVPYQTITGNFAIGVVAFHQNGIDRVEFSVDGGPWQPVYDMTENPRTGIWEFTANLDVSQYREGPIEVRAVAYPVAGVPRVLAGPHTNAPTNGQNSMFLFADPEGDSSPARLYVSTSGSDTNPGTQASPKRTIKSALEAATDGAEIIIMTAGDWEIMPRATRLNNQRWVTLRAADGLDWDDVIIRQVSSNLIMTSVSRMRYHNIAFDYNSFLQIGESGGADYWFDRVRLYDAQGVAPSKSNYFQPVASSATGNRVYVTDSYAHDVIYGWTDAILHRNTHHYRIGGDNYQNCRMVVGSTADTVISPTLHHTDIFQYFMPGEILENIIAYNVRVSNAVDVQNFYADTAAGFRDFAFVDIAIENTGTDTGLANQFSGDFKNIFFLHVSSPGRRWLFHNQQPIWKANDFLIQNSAFGWIADGTAVGGLPAGVTMLHSTVPQYYKNVPIGIGTLMGDVSVKFTSPTPGGVMYHDGALASGLVGSGLKVPGFRRGPWADDDNTPRDRGAIEE